MQRRGILIRAGLGGVVVWALGAAAFSPLTAWRDPVYIGACLAGVAALALMLLQPLWIGGALTGRPARRQHALTGAAILAAVILHVAGLWLTSPPDVIDALLLVSPTPFAVWGVLALWALVASAALALWRRGGRLTPRHWRLAHSVLAVVIVAGSLAHALLIEGLMGQASKLALCALILAATVRVLARRRVWLLLTRKGPGAADP